MSEGKDVHTEHCCVIHGCKYGDEKCPVALKQKPQSFPCESCDNVESLTAAIQDLEARVAGMFELPKYTDTPDGRVAIFHVRHTLMKFNQRLEKVLSKGEK